MKLLVGLLLVVLLNNARIIKNSHGTLIKCAHQQGIRYFLWSLVFASLIYLQLIVRVLRGKAIE